MSNGKEPIDKLAGDVIAADSAKAASRPGKTQPTTTAPQGRVSQLPRRWLAPAAVLAVVVLAAGSFFAVRAIQGGGQNNPAATKVALAAAVNCDCPHVDAGLLTGPYIRQCQQREQQLKQLVAQGTFHVVVGPDHKIVSGDLCDDVAVGPAGWPVAGGPENPPPASGQPPCKYVGGLVQYKCGSG
ncbi:MAG: hypothetical protein ACYDAL_04185 [Candidatus Dormibacteraceae bacterium]